MKAASSDNSRPVVVYAKASSERDYLRNVVPKHNRVICFEKENICLDNLTSLDPQIILLRTDAGETIWRFILALDAMGIDSGLLLLTNQLGGHRFDASGLDIKLNIISNIYESIQLPEKINNILKYGTSLKGTGRRETMLGSSPMIKSIASKLPGLCQTSDPLLIAGERGTGKELLARMIARSESRRFPLFIKIDCEAVAAGREGFFNSFDSIFKRDDVQGKSVTVLFSKIDQMDPKSQSEALLLLEKDFKKQTIKWGRIQGLRVIATSESDLDSLVRQNRFRQDLYYRINVIPIRLPALRERKDDIPLLMDHFIIRACVEQKRSLLFPSPYLSARLCSYAWPGNLDELRNAMYRLAISGSEDILLRQLGFNHTKQDPYRCLHNAIGPEAVLDLLEIHGWLSSLNGASLKSIGNRFAFKIEQALLRKALEITNWNRKKAAALLHISYKSMLNKMKMYEII